MTVGEDFVSGTRRRVATVPPDTNQNSAPAFFHHIFLVRPSQTPNRNPAIIPRQCSIENCARLQRRTHHPPQNHFRRLFDKQTTSRRQAVEAVRPHPKSARQTAESSAKSLFM